MLNQTQNVICYKWDDRTRTGYRLRYDIETAMKGGHYCYHVEDWTYHTVTNEWQCQTLEDAVKVLNHLFDIDVEQELGRLGAWPKSDLLAAA